MNATRTLVLLPLFLLACGGEPDAELAEIGAELTTQQVDRANAAIPDNNSAGITRGIDIVVDPASVDRVRVVVRISHPYRGDLSVALTSPAGTRVVLHNRTGGSADNLSIDRRLNDFNGEAAGGRWTLTVADHARADVGRLVSWALAVEHTAIDPCAAVRCAAGTVCELQEVQCIRAPCPPIAVCVPESNPCALVRCAAGTHCEVQEVQCARAPCPPVAACVPDQGPFCGSRGNQVYCATTEYCHHEPRQTCGWADAQGECRTKPQVCTRIYRPVCGCDRNTYGNDCEAHAAGVSVQYEGACRPSGAYWDTKGADFGSSNPYRNNEVLETTFYAPPDGSRIRIHFDRFNLEANYDFVRVYGATGVELAAFTGNLGVFDRELELDGDRVRVVFTSDGSITRPGFHIDSIAWYRTP